MKTRPILMNGEMVRAVLAGRKSQTRRIVKAKDADPSRCIAMPTLMKNIGEWREQNGRWFGIDGYDTLVFCDCPYGRVGDRLYMRETWADVNSYDGPAIAYRADGAIRSWREFSETYGPDYGAGPSMDYDAYPGEYVMWSNDLLAGEPEHNWRPSIHMPKWASRITLEITDVRVERLIDISDADAIAEGIERTSNGLYCRDYIHGTRNVVLPIYSFMTLWQSIYGPESWSANPWVFAIAFKRLEGVLANEN